MDDLARRRQNSSALGDLNEAAGAAADGQPGRSSRVTEMGGGSGEVELTQRVRPPERCDKLPAKHPTEDLDGEKEAGCHLKVGHIDSQRMVLRVERGKGGVDREVPLSPTLLTALREYYRWMRPQTYLFPGCRMARLAGQVDPPGHPTPAAEPRQTAGIIWESKSVMGDAEGITDAGARIGAHQIVDAIGAGVMGEVYRARSHVSVCVTRSPDFTDSINRFRSSENR